MVGSVRSACSFTKMCNLCLSIYIHIRRRVNCISTDAAHQSLCHLNVIIINLHQHIAREKCLDSDLSLKRRRLLKYFITIIECRCVRWCDDADYRCSHCNLLEPKHYGVIGMALRLIYALLWNIFHFNQKLRLNGMEKLLPWASQT